MMNEELTKIFNDYVEDLKLIGHRERGVSGLKNKVKRLFEYIESNGLTLNQIGINEAQNYQGWLKDYGKQKGIKYKNSTIKGLITASISFYEYLKKNQYIDMNPFKEIMRVKPEKVLPRNLPKEKELNIFLKELSKFDDEKNFRKKTTRFKIWIASELMYATGLRIAEAANLKISDIDFDRGLINVVEGKMGKNRICFLNEFTEKLLRIYIYEFRELVLSSWNKENLDLLFAVKWDPFEKTVNKVLKRISEKLNYPKFTSHAFRHCLGYHLLRSDCDIRYIQVILGHKSLKDTEVYTKVDKEELKEVFDKYHPRTFKRGNEDVNKKLLPRAV